MASVHSYLLNIHSLHSFRSTNHILYWRFIDYITFDFSLTYLPAIRNKASKEKINFVLRWICGIKTFDFDTLHDIPISSNSDLKSDLEMWRSVAEKTFDGVTSLAALSFTRMIFIILQQCLINQIHGNDRFPFPPHISRWTMYTNWMLGRESREFGFVLKLTLRLCWSTNILRTRNTRFNWHILKNFPLQIYMHNITFG